MMSCKCSKNQIEIFRNGFVPTCEECPEGMFHEKLNFEYLFKYLTLTFTGTLSSPDQTGCLNCNNGTCHCPSQSTLIFRDASGNLLTNDAFCGNCASGFYRNDNGYCTKCETSCSEMVCSFTF